MLAMYEPYLYGFSHWMGHQDDKTYRELGSVRGYCYGKVLTKKTGHVRTITAHASRGLVLSWFVPIQRNRVCATGLVWFYRVSCANVWLHFGRRMLLKPLVKLDEAKVRMPSDEEIVQQQNANLLWETSSVQQMG